MKEKSRVYTHKLSNAGMTGFVCATQRCSSTSTSPHAQKPVERPGATRHTRFVWHDAHWVKPIDGCSSRSTKRHVASSAAHSSLAEQPCSARRGRLHVHVLVTS